MPVGSYMESQATVRNNLRWHMESNPNRCCLDSKGGGYLEYAEHINMLMTVKQDTIWLVVGMGNLLSEGHTGRPEAGSSMRSRKLHECKFL